MTVIEIENRLIDIKNALPDAEAAHDAEDRLRHDFICYVAGAGDAQLSRMATVVLSSSQIEFPRHCA